MGTKNIPHINRWGEQMMHAHLKFSHFANLLRVLFVLFLVSAALLSSDCQRYDATKTSKMVVSETLIDLKPLLVYDSDARMAISVDLSQLTNLGNRLNKTAPMWPVYDFLMGEMYRLRNEPDKALESYKTLVEWAVTDDGDKWGKSGLSAVALWRLLQLYNMQEVHNHEETDHILNIAQRLLQTKLVRGMFNVPVLASLPKLEEDILRQMAILAWHSDMKDKALTLFLDYLSISSTAELSLTEMHMKRELIYSGRASRDRLALLQGKRLFSHKMFKDALVLFNEAQKSKDTEVEAEASFYISQMPSYPKNFASEKLENAINFTRDPDLIQEALYKRAIKLRGKGRIEDYLKDLNQIIKDFPSGKRTDDSLYEIAQHYHYAGDIEKSLSYFEKVRTYKGKKNDYTDRALFQSAMILFARGGEADLKKATSLLKELKDRDPFGPLHLTALFWLGRIAAETDDHTQARTFFQQIINESPYDYYAVRARMHLKLGVDASKELWPDKTTKDELHNAYLRSSHRSVLKETTPYHQRLNASLETGLYSMALNAYIELRKRYASQRLEELSLKVLDESGMLPHVSLLLALRQDALAAKDAIKNESEMPKNLLQIANAVGNKGSDWTLSMDMIIAQEAPPAQRAAVQRSDAYLDTAYPVRFKEFIMKASNQYNVKPELLYSVIRRESLFYPAAISASRALGLFQFTPDTFGELNTKWNLLKSSGSRSMEEFLLNPEWSINLGARWFKDIKLENNQGNILFAVIEHNAGPNALHKCISFWDRLNRRNDIEYMIETIRFGETRIFSRGLLSDMVIVDAIGIFRTE